MTGYWGEFELLISLAGFNLSLVALLSNFISYYQQSGCFLNPIVY